MTDEKAIQRFLVFIIQFVTTYKNTYKLFCNWYSTFTDVQYDLIAFHVIFYNTNVNHQFSYREVAFKFQRNINKKKLVNCIL